MQVTGSVHKTTFHNPDNGYSVVKIVSEDTGEIFTAVGVFPRLTEGESIELGGDWAVHPVFGKQFKSDSFKVRPPTDSESIIRFLSGGTFKGVGPVQARNIVTCFGDTTFDVLDNHPERLKEVRGMGKKKRESFLAQWNEKRSVRDIMAFLQAHHLTLNLCNRILKHYGPDALSILKNNPYQLADELWGIGFQKADQIAEKLGFGRDSYERIRAGLVHTLTRASEEGHVFLPREQLLSSASEILGCGEELILFTLDNLTDSKAIKNDSEGRFYRPYLFHSETGISRRIHSLLTARQIKIPEQNILRGIGDAEIKFSSGAHSNFSYQPEQKDAIRKAAGTGVFILTGGPGTGKTTTLMGILHVFESQKFNVVMAAPTGRAAKRMSEITGRTSRTIHRLLQFEPASGKFLLNEEKPLEADAVIIDEVSMIDTLLMFSLVRALAPGTRLILIGDDDQLPSVGPGKVLSELIASQIIPHVHLQNIIRQESTSQIILNAHRINHGTPPDFDSPEKDFHFRHCPDAQAALEKTADLVCNRLPAHFGYDPKTDIHVLSPMNRGSLGTIFLNTGLQARLNPSGTGLKFGEQTFKPGDKVMQLRNDYERNVFNGDIGIIRSVEPGKQSLVAVFDEPVAYERDELAQLSLAYATTIHKSQGSEYRCIILLLTHHHFVMLQRNLLYTAITRARERVFILGTQAAVQRAVENNPAVLRHTLLATRLREAFKS